MVKLLKLLTSRLFFSVLAIVLQLLFVLIPYFLLRDYYVVIDSATGIISALVALFIFCRDDALEYRVSWIMLVLIFPVFGWTIYLFFGNKKQSGKEKTKKINYQQVVHDIWEDETGRAVEPESMDNPDNTVLARYIQNHSNAMVYGNSEVTYYPQSDQAWLPLLEALESAERFIFIEFFIMDRGYVLSKVVEILERKAARGVRVCLMYDDIGCMLTLPSNFCRKLRKKGIETVRFNPVRPRLNPRLNYRDHRKVCIIDGNTVISGGLNLADEYFNKRIRFGHWKDNSFIIKGDGVWNYTLMFMQLWNFSCPTEYLIKNYRDYAPDHKIRGFGGLIQSYGDSPLDSDCVAENSYLKMIGSAHKYVWISTPYLILDSAMRQALILAAKSNIDVRIITPAIPDKKAVFELTRSNYYQLVESGVKIYEYLPGFIHAKMFVSDDKRAILGTTNMDFRSFFLNFECATVFYGGKTVMEVKKDFLRTFECCRQIPADYRNTVGRFRRVFRGAVSAFEPLL